MRSAFTLIEQLAASALVALLLGASVAVLAGIARQRHDAATTATIVDEPARRIGRMIAWDLTNADRFRVDGPGLTCAGYDALDPASMVPTHRPVRVSYRIEQTDGAPRLVRVQSELDVMSNRNTAKSLVAADVIRFHVTPLGALTAPATRPASDQSDGFPVPQAVELSVTFTSGRTFRQVVWLR